MWRMMLFLLVVCVVVAGPVMAKPAPYAGNTDPGIAQPNSTAYGKTLGEWLELYWTWWITDGDPATSKVGPVQFMPMPTDSDITDGTGEPGDPLIYSGHVDITLAPGTPFVLPVAGRI